MIARTRAMSYPLRMTAAGPDILTLCAHPRTPAGFVRRLDAAIARVDGGRTLYLDYCLEADLGRLALPAASAPERRDGLWQHTCFEAFMKLPGETDYLELNFSPSGAWAAYCFDEYRQGARPAPTGRPTRFALSSSDTQINLQLAVDLTPCAGLVAAGVLEAGLAAVLEDRDGMLSYWALAHSSEHPDFHRAQDWRLCLRVTDPGADA